jgi:lycopene beta-cyclase
VIQTKEPVFNTGEATLMDFRVSQEHGTSFIYVLPFLEDQALIEYTVFSEKILDNQSYFEALQDYISTISGIGEYTVLEEEFGIIPMTNINFVKRIGRVVNIGTAGGQTKGSSGYTFNFIQKHSDKIVSDLTRYGFVKENDPFIEKRFKIYDSALLNVLAGNKMPGDKIFSDLFSKNPVDRVLRFLDNETSFEDEINLMATLPRGIFAKALLQEMFK